MSRTNNKYINTISGEELNIVEMYNFINQEAKRQYEECTGNLWCNLTIDEQQECILNQWNYQLSGDWECIQ